MNKRFSVFLAALFGAIMSLTAQQYQIPINDASSLVRVGMNPHPVAEGDTLLAYTLMNALDNRDLDSLSFVCEAYRKKSLNKNIKERSWGSLAYILDRMIKDGTGEEFKKGDILTEDLYHYFTYNECAHLRNYLVIKYELNNYRPRSVKEHINQRTFYDDLLMYNDPNRETWDETNTIMSNLPIKRGDKIVDVGCGFGFNSYRILDLVGNEGMVYATDTEAAYTEHLSQLLNENGINNLVPLQTQSNELGVNDTVDCIFMSSLYHIIYTWSREDERASMITSIKKQLRDGGHMVIVDNYNLNGEELNNCHVDPRLIQAQLGFWGFEPVSLISLSEQRYMLILRHNDKYRPNCKVNMSENIPILNITGQKSVVHIGSLDSYDITDRGINAAQYVYDFMGGGDKSLAEIAIKKYEELIPLENFGGEYSALQWLCEVALASEAEREQMMTDPLDKSFYNYLTADNNKVIRYYLLHKYKLGNDSIRMLSDSILEKSGEVGRTHRSYLEDYILALNPKRTSWENTGKILDNLGLKPGESIADIGSGSGFFTHRFSNMVGENGKVYAIELKDEHIERLSTFLTENSVDNVTVIKGSEEKLELPELVDRMFMCSLYHIMYGVIPDNERDSYLKSLVKCLKPGGELIIVDNGPVDNETLPYHGPYINPELIVFQLSYYGFELVDQIQIIPQRYMLKFKLKD